VGVNVCLYRGECERHPAWDVMRHSGDREMWEILNKCGADRKRVGHEWDGVWHERPRDVGEFRNAMIAAHPENEARWRKMADILEDPEWWIYFGY